MKHDVLFRKATLFCLSFALFLGCSYLYMDHLAGFAVPDTEFFTLEISALLISGFFCLAGKKYFLLLFLPLLWLIGALCIFPLSHKPLHFLSFMPFMGFSAGLWGLWAALLILLERGGRKKYPVFLYALLFPLLPFLVWSYYFMNGSWPIYTALLAIWQTNGKEAMEYGISHFHPVVFILLIFTFTYAGHIAGNAKKFPSLLISKAGAWILSAASILSFYLIYVSRDNLLTEIYFQARDCQTSYLQFQKEKEHRSRQMEETLKTISASPHGIHVLVIGESENRKHMSAYGYQRPTTPHLEKAAGNPHFILYTDTYSCHVQTVQALSYALTAKNQYNHIPLEKAPSLIECAKTAGFHTIWLSNQEKYSLYDTPTSVIASEADKEIWLNHNIGTDLKTEVYDGEIVNRLKNLEITSPTLLIIHLMGSHRAYWERYPRECAVFEGDNWLTDTYDNSILYTDRVLHEIYETVKTIPHFQSMVYFSDHSEGIDEGLDHNASIFTWDMTYIPFYMAFSDEYMKNHRQKIDEIKKHKDDPFTNDLIFHLMMSLMEIDIPDYREKTNDITTQDYDPGQERFRTLFGEKKIIENNDSPK